MNKFSRTEMLIGKESMNKIKKAKVAIFGIGGVGSYVVEALVRAGVQKFILVDKDIVSETNINRQLVATTKTIGMDKVEVAKTRILEINPEAEVTIFKEFYMPENNNKIIDNSITYIVDAIDTVKAKIGLIEEAKKLSIPIISCMGTGNKLDPTKFEIVDIEKTSVCPLAKVIRKELKKKNIRKVKVLYSKEEPIRSKENIENNTEKDNEKKVPPASISFVPSVAGLIIAGEVIKDLIKEKELM
ncbi:MAG: tRNA threonylcarbamoyladenosine dehydratase [Clostridiaceae bacterium]|nr:tRNA threonylcarbamoyladenosine dehydratase [Clostridiaceae bacterium]